MTTVQETTIAQNQAIISLLSDLLQGKKINQSIDTKTNIERAEKCALGWLENIDENGEDEE